MITDKPPIFRRILPAVILFLLSPVVGEYLLGNMAFAQWKIFPILAFVYGGGTVLVRELARAYRRGWPTMLMLAFAYALVEEGLSTQSLFNDHFLGLHLLTYGYVPQLGIGLPWSVYVLGLHTFWSVSVPIVLVEALFPDRQTTTWLRWPGRTVCAVLYIVGSFGVFVSLKHIGGNFVASPLQLGVTTILIVAVSIAAFAFTRPIASEVLLRSSAKGGATPMMFGLLAFVAGSLFHLWQHVAQNTLKLPGFATAIGLILLPTVVGLAILKMIRRGRWSNEHTRAIGIGVSLVYGWWGFILTTESHGSDAWVGQLVPVALLVVVLLAIRSADRKRG